jgi:choline transport protein
MFCFTRTNHTIGDEVKLVRTRVPRSIVLSVIGNRIVRFIYVVVLLFILGNLDQVVNSSTRLPLIEVYYQATSSKAATNLFVVMVTIVPFVGPFNTFASVSRLTWAFSRDHGLPFARFFSHVS